MELPKTGDVLLGKYVLEERLGEGGMGVVYAARHLLLAQRVAVKLIRSEIAKDAETVARFVNEARAAARIENEHIARVLDVGMLDEGSPYMVLEILEGADLGRILRERGPLPLAEVADHLLQTIEAVACAHSLGIVHRDLKPSNLFLARRRDGTARIKVLDFGIAKATREVDGPSANMTKKNSMLGSPHYMSPEQLRDAASVDHRSDIWALGIVAYELLSGRPPFDGETTVAVFASIQESEPASLRGMRADIPRAVEAAILKCLARTPDARFASVTDFGRALAPFGTALAARALENATRILPPSGESPPPTTGATLRIAARNEVEEEAVLSATLRAPPEVGARLPSSDTVNAVTSSRGGTTRTTPKKRNLTLAVAALIAAAGLVLFIVGPRARAIPGAAATSASSTEPSVKPPPVPPVSPLAPPSSDPLAHARTSEPVSDRPDAPVIAKPRVPAILAARDAATPAPPPASAPAIPAGCSPQYTFDGDGKKIWKPECFR